VSKEYEHLTIGVGLIDLAGRTLIEVTGADRALFLHNMCTADVQRLKPGQGCEAFFTDASAKILAHAYFFAEESRIVIETVPGEGERLIAHLDRYIFREDVKLSDRTTDWHEWLLAGPESQGLLEKLSGKAVPKVALEHAETTLAGVACVVRFVDWTTAGGYLLQTTAAQAEEVGTALERAGAVRCSADALAVARLEAGTPVSGIDITGENLPQEIDRDARAISFTKGCYIGQETVARIDALGHVNKLLRLVKFAGSTLPEAGTELTAEGKAVGRVTSAIYSPKLNCPLALAFVRRGLDRPGSKLDSSVGPAEVIAAPA
jgi:folate-binding protein YgfZ